MSAAVAEAAPQVSETHGKPPREWQLLGGTSIADSSLEIELEPIGDETIELAPQSSEVHGKSLGTLRHLGETAAAGVGSEADLELARDDFVTALGEMIKTDPEYRHYLDVNQTKQFAYRDGKTRAADGTPMVEIVEAGYTASSKDSDIRISTSQAERDSEDRSIAQEADNLRVGESFLAVSIEPKTELAGKDAVFWRNRGYREGIAYIQWYSRTAEDELSASAISVDHSDLEKWKELLGGKGVEVPEKVTANTFIRHTYHFEGDAKTAQTTAEKLRLEYYRRVGAPGGRISVTEFLEANQPLTDAMFDAYIPVMSRALLTGKNPTELRAFARQALATIPPDKLSSEVRTQLMRTANLRKFDDDMARAMNDTLLYATVEQLRSGLATILAAPRVERNVVPTQLRIAGVEQYARMQQTQLHTVAIAGLQRGVEAQRSYGGCSGTNVAKSSVGVDEVVTPQDIFGGKSLSKEEDSGPDGLGPLTFKCTEGHVNRRERGKLLKECQTKPCKKGSVGCA